MRFLYVLLVLLLPLNARAQEVTIFAAASLTDAMKDISAKWAEAGHKPLTMSFGSRPFSAVERLTAWLILAFTTRQESNAASSAP